jgi:hypothetical protein
VTVTVFPVPTVGVSNVAAPAHVTVSPLTAPVSAQSDRVALVVPSYALFDAVTAAVSVLAVIAAVVVEVGEASA